MMQHLFRYRPLTWATSVAALLWLLAGVASAQKSKPTSPPAPIPYKIVTLRLPGTETDANATGRATGINNLGQVVGYADTADGGSHPFMYTPSDWSGAGVVQDLRELVEFTCPTMPDNWEIGWAWDINDKGQVIGDLVFTDGSGYGGSYRYNPAGVNGTEAEIEFLGYMQATAINDDGDVVGVGYGVGPGGRDEPVLWTDQDGLTLLPRPTDGRFWWPKAIGNRTNGDGGKVAGSTVNNRAPTEPVLYVPGVGVKSLGYLKASIDATATAADMNSAGKVVGRSTVTRFVNHAFLYPGVSGGMQDLGTLGGEHSAACGINDFGEIVGHSTIKGGGNPMFLYYKDANGVTGMVNVTSSIVNLPLGVQPGAQRINDNRWICASEMCAYVLIPLSPPQR
jgi:probable HAF family extracellular repeat protein